MATITFSQYNTNFMAIDSIQPKTTSPWVCLALKQFQHKAISKEDNMNAIDLSHFQYGCHEHNKEEDQRNITKHLTVTKYKRP